MDKKKKKDDANDILYIIRETGFDDDFVVDTSAVPVLEDNEEDEDDLKPL